MTPKEHETAIGELEERVDRLRILYDQYFLGFEKLEPMVPRKDVERRIAILRKEQIRNTAMRWRFNVVNQKYNTYSMYWQRIARQIEEGTFKRHLQRAKKILEGPASSKREGAMKADAAAAEATFDVDTTDFEPSELDQMLAEADAAVSGLERGAPDTVPPKVAAEAHRTSLETPVSPFAPVRPPGSSARLGDAVPQAIPRAPESAPMKPAAAPAGSKPRLIRKLKDGDAPISSPALSEAQPTASRRGLEAPGLVPSGRGLVPGAPESSPRTVAPATQSSPRMPPQSSPRLPPESTPQVAGAHGPPRMAPAAPPGSVPRIAPIPGSAPRLPPGSAPGLPRMAAAAPPGSAPRIAPRTSQPDAQEARPRAPVPSSPDLGARPPAAAPPSTAAVGRPAAPPVPGQRPPAPSRPDLSGPETPRVNSQPRPAAPVVSRPNPIAAGPVSQRVPQMPAQAPPLPPRIVVPTPMSATRPTAPSGAGPRPPPVPSTASPKPAIPSPEATPSTRSSAPPRARLPLPSELKKDPKK